MILTTRDESCNVHHEETAIMNPEKWKSVVITVPSYNKLKALARSEHRTISGQFTHMLEKMSEVSDPKTTKSASR